MSGFALCRYHLKTKRTRTIKTRNICEMHTCVILVRRKMREEKLSFRRVVPQQRRKDSQDSPETHYYTVQTCCPWTCLQCVYLENCLKIKREVRVSCRWILLHLNMPNSKCLTNSSNIYLPLSFSACLIRDSVHWKKNPW